MTPTRCEAVNDTYLYDIPIKEREALCGNLLEKNIWQNLAVHMGYDNSEIDEIKRTSFQPIEQVEELIARWGEQNHTITELFVLLSR